MKMRRAILISVLASVATAAIYFLWPRSQNSREDLTVFCAAGLKQAVEKIAVEFERETGNHVSLQFGGTGTLLAQMEAAHSGDVFIAADGGAMADAKKRNLVRESIPLVRQTPVIAVAKGNPKGVKSFQDLVRRDVKVALANPEAASIGKTVKAAAGDSWPQLAAAAMVMKPTVTEIAADLSLGAVDAAVIWDATVAQFKNIEAVTTPELSRAAETSNAGVVASSARPAAALRFARYLAAPEKGGAVWKQAGFEALMGDSWKEKPELVIYSGAVNRPALEKLLQQFADREGASINSVYNGCGVLCASMKAMKDAKDPKFPDVYFACDLCFVPPVAESFPEAVVLTETDIGIVVRKGNPRGVKTLTDLAAPGMKLGTANAVQSTLGYLTRGLLKSSGLTDSLRSNVVVESPTADLLINQMRAGGLDAAIVYRVNWQPQAEHLDFIALPQAEAKALQPFSVRKKSPHRQLAGRLLEYLQQNRAVFEAAGFQWKNAAPIASKDIAIPDWLKPAEEK